MLAQTATHTRPLTQAQSSDQIQAKVETHPSFDQHEQLFFKRDEISGLNAIIAVHNTNLGPALGGCRMHAYTTDDDALNDVLRLSRGMTYKSALAGLPLGGGKAVIIGHPVLDKTPALLHSMGDFIEELGGIYITAEDSGSSVADMKLIAERTRHVSGVNEADEYGGDPSPSTALGVFNAIAAAVEFKHHTNLQGVRVAIQGVGNVGFHLARLLRNAGAKVYAADINPRNIQRAISEVGVTQLPLDQVLTAEVDVLAPCALGGAISARSIDRINAGIVAGAANNQLATAEMGSALFERDILYAPDFVANAGGIVDIHYQTQGVRDSNLVRNHIDRIAQTLSQIFNRSKEQQLPTSEIADAMAEEIFLPQLSNKG